MRDPFIDISKTNRCATIPENRRDATLAISHPSCEHLKLNSGNPFDELLFELCSRHAYCGWVKDGVTTHVTDYIPKSGPVTAYQFVEWLLEADGYNLHALSRSEHKQLHSDLDPIFIKHMGSDCVDAAELSVSSSDQLGRRKKFITPY